MGLYVDCCELERLSVVLLSRTGRGGPGTRSSRLGGDSAGPGRVAVAGWALPAIPVTAKST